MKKLVLVLAVASISMYACKEKTTKEKIQEAAEAVGDDIEDAIEDAGEKVEEAADEAGDKTEKGIDKLKKKISE